MANITNNKISFYITGSEVMAVSSSGELLVSSSALYSSNLLISQSNSNTSSLVMLASRDADVPSSFTNNTLSKVVFSQSNINGQIGFGSSYTWDQTLSGKGFGLVNYNFTNLAYLTTYDKGAAAIINISVVRGGTAPDFYSTTMYSPKYAANYGTMIWVWPYGNQLEFGYHANYSLTFNNNGFIHNVGAGQPINFTIAKFTVGIGGTPRYVQANISGNLNIISSSYYGITSSFGAEKLYVSGNVAPSINDSFDLGVSSSDGLNVFRWNDVYATNGTIITSDKDFKKDIQTSKLGLQFINDLKPVRYKFINNSSDRTHYGLIAQEVYETLKKFDIEASDFAGYISGNYGGYSLRYDEFIAPLIKAIQELSARINALEKEIEARGL